MAEDRLSPYHWNFVWNGCYRMDHSFLSYVVGMKQLNLKEGVNIKYKSVKPTEHKPTCSTTVVVQLCGDIAV